MVSVISTLWPAVHSEESEAWALLYSRAQGHTSLKRMAKHYAVLALISKNLVTVLGQRAVF